MYVSSILPKRTIPLTEPPLDSSRPFWRAKEYDLGHSSIPQWHASMRATRRQGVLGVIRCGTGPSPRMRARTSPGQHLLRGDCKRGLHAFQGGQRHHGCLGAPEEEKAGEGVGGREEATAGEPVLAMPLWGVLKADDDGVVSQSPVQLRKMMGSSWSCAWCLSSPHRSPGLRSCAYAQSGCWSPPPHSA